MLTNSGQPPLWERAVGALIVFLATGAVFSLLMADSVGQSNSVLQGLWLLIYVLCSLLLFSKGVNRSGVLRYTAVILVLLALCLVSAWWSEAPLLSLRRSFALVGTTITGIYFGVRYDREGLLSVVAWGLGLSILVSLAFVLFIPHYGIQAYLGGQDVVRGAYLTKNELGRVMALGVLVWMLFAPRSPWTMLVRWMALAGAVGLLIASMSKTAVVVLVVLLAARIFVPVLRWQTSIVLPTFAVLTTVGATTAAWLVGRSDELLGLLGRDITLTGRTLLWESVWSMIRAKVWLGYGFGTFWMGWDGPSAFVWLYNFWQPPHSHNGVLDLWLSVGLLGVTLFVWLFGKNLVGSLILLRVGSQRSAAFPFTLLLYLLMYNITESNLLNQNSLFWILFVVVTVQIGRAGFSHRHGVQLSPQSSRAVTVQLGMTNLM